jgi:ferric-dicitrate binding protein FerR (iron transport regulator)
VRRGGTIERVAARDPDWLDGELAFENVPLRDALDRLGEWIGLSIVCDAAACANPVSFTTPIGQSRAAARMIVRREGLRWISLSGVAWVRE